MNTRTPLPSAAEAEIRLLTSFFRTPAEVDFSTDWILQVERGHWEQIPSHITYREADMLAMLVDGYRLGEHLLKQTERSRAAATLAEEQRRLFTSERQWVGSAAELWVTLFFSKRADRMVLNLENESPDPRFDLLCSALRSALIEGRLWPQK